MHETEYFKDVVRDVADRSGISDEIVEKDYYVTNDHLYESDRSVMEEYELLPFRSE